MEPAQKAPPNRSALAARWGARKTSAAEVKNRFRSVFRSFVTRRSAKADFPAVAAGRGDQADQAEGSALCGAREELSSASRTVRILSPTAIPSLTRNLHRLRA